MDTVVLTPEGFDRIKRELEQLKTVGRTEISERIRRARLLGDLSENFDYQDAKRQQGMMEGRIQDLEKMLQMAVIREPQRVDGVVSLGSLVTLGDPDSGEQLFQVRIVDTTMACDDDEEIEAVTATSPMGHALLERSVGDIIEVTAPRGTLRYQIQAVSHE